MIKPNIAAIIIGIDGWERYTLPLIYSIREHEPDCRIVTVDNASSAPYLDYGVVTRTERLCYSAAINHGKAKADELLGLSDWYIVLSNDVLCTGPFADTLAQYDGSDLVGPLIKQIHIERVGLVDYIEGWCVAISRKAWNVLGGWDDGMKISSYEDVDISHRARKAGMGLVEDLPFVHLDQKQRFYLVPDYWSSEYHNRARFIEKHAVVNG